MFGPVALIGRGVSSGMRPVSDAERNCLYRAVFDVEYAHHRARGQRPAAAATRALAQARTALGAIPEHVNALHSFDDPSSVGFD